MTMVQLRSLKAVAGLPSDRTSLSLWMKRHNVPTSMTCGRGGQQETVCVSDLPETVRRAYVERQLESSGLPPGTYDEAAHSELSAMPAKMRAEAERKAEIARVLLTVGKALPWSGKVALVKSRFGSKGISQPSLSRLLKAVQGVAPINFAPALLAEYRLQGAPSVLVSDAA